jgi:phosphopantothenoylcysteine decarboxylase/phosphopantothenate--cysteine ligase
VTLLAANLGVPAPGGVEVVDAPTAEDMAREALARAAAADLVIMTAAIADYRPAQARADKRAKDTSKWTVELEPTTDILAELGKRAGNGHVLVGFAADIGEQGLARAREKLATKKANLFVFNDVSRADIGFDATENEVVLLTRDGERRIGKAPKEQIAAAVLDEAGRLLKEGNGRPAG